MQRSIRSTLDRLAPTNHNQGQSDWCSVQRHKKTTLYGVSGAGRPRLPQARCIFILKSLS